MPPPLLAQIQAAIVALKQRKGCSRQAIAKFVKEAYGSGNATALSKALKKGEESGQLLKNKQSYRVCSSSKQAANKKKPSAAKKQSVQDTTLMQVSATNNDRPCDLAKKLETDVDVLLAWNVERYPNLKATSRLKKGTLLFYSSNNKMPPSQAHKRRTNGKQAVKTKVNPGADKENSNNGAGVDWQTHRKAHCWMGKKALRVFKSQEFSGVVVGYLPPEPNQFGGQDPGLFRLQHEDGDTEDLYEHELVAAMEAQVEFEARPPPRSDQENWEAFQALKPDEYAVYEKNEAVLAWDENKAGGVLTRNAYQATVLGRRAEGTKGRGDFAKKRKKGSKGRGGVALADVDADAATNATTASGQPLGTAPQARAAVAATSIAGTAEAADSADSAEAVAAETVVTQPQPTPPRSVKYEYLLHFHGFHKRYDRWQSASLLLPMRIETTQRLFAELHPYGQNKTKPKMKLQARDTKYAPEGFPPALKAAEYGADLATHLRLLGLAHLKGALREECVAMLATSVEEWFNAATRHVNTLGMQDVLEGQGFTDFKTRTRGRYDLNPPGNLDLAAKVLRGFTHNPATDIDPQYDWLFAREAPWMRVVHAALGADCECIACGCMLSFPGSVAQPLHQDGPHLSKSGKPLDRGSGEAGDEDAIPASATHLPAHAINIFIPLVDLTQANGATEFFPTTHILRQYELTDGAAAPTVPLAKAGDAILFDYRVKHRGLGNNSQSARPLLYITYARPGFKDSANFSARRYRKLPVEVYAYSRSSSSK